MNGYERATKEVVPAARLAIARELKARYNMTEGNIAKILGVAQAAVSKYLNGNYSETVSAAAGHISMELVNRHIEQIAKGNQEELKKLVCTICWTMNRFDCRFSGADAAVAEKAKEA